MKVIKKIIPFLGALILIGAGCMNNNDPRFVNFVITNNENVSKYINFDIMPAEFDSIRQYKEKYGDPMNIYLDGSGNSVYEFKESNGLIEVTDVADEEVGGIAVEYTPNALIIDDIFKNKLLTKASELTLEDGTTIIWVINSENWGDSTIHYGFKIKGQRIISIF